MSSFFDSKQSAKNEEPAERRHSQRSSGDENQKIGYDLQCT